jgi:hypothetical protein
MNQSYTYPFIAANHHALMLLMLRKNLKYLNQVKSMFSHPIRPLPPYLDPDPNKPLVYLYTGPAKSKQIEFEAFLRGDV